MIRGASDERPSNAQKACKKRRWLTSLPRRLHLETLEDRHLLAAAAGGTAAIELDAGYAPTALIVQFRPESQFAGSLRAHVAGNIVGTPWEIAPGMREVQIAPGTALDEAVSAFAGDPNVIFAEPNYRMRLNMLPDDPKFASEQWHLNNTGQIEEPPGSDINAPQAWDETMGDPSVIVAVIDTGIDYNHPDLANNIWRNEGEGTAVNGIDDDNNGYVDDMYGYDFANRDSDPMDDHLHGTHIAGTIAAVANNGQGVAGVAPGVRVMALKFLDSRGNGLTSDAISALNYAVANGAKISNNSFGGGPQSQAFKSAIENAMFAGHVFVAAAGNYGTNIDQEPFYPASYEVDNIITVGATDAADTLAWFSNYGKKSVDVGAPGVDIYSTLPTTPTEEMANRGFSEPYGALSGTSMAAPIVAGVAALIMSQNDGLSAREVIDQILATADKSPALSTKTVSGGRVNAAGSLGEAPVDSIFPTVVAHDPSGTVAGAISQVNLTFSEPIDASSFDFDDVIGMNGPLGPVTIFAVELSSLDSRKFKVTFDTQTEPGEYSLLVGPHITDLAGNELDQNGDGVPGMEGFDHYTASFQIATAEADIYASPDVPLEIDGFDPIISYLTITDDLPIADLNVQLNLTFPRAGDLHVWLVSPAETIINLSYRHGGEAADFTDTVFDDEAGLWIADVEAPFTGSFQPDDPLNTLDIENAFGTWQLVIQNVSEIDEHGTLNAWSLQIVRRESGGGGGEEEETNEPPIAVDDSLNGFQGTPLEIDPQELLFNDSDPNNDPLELTSVRGAVGGAVAQGDDGMILFVPSASSLGLASFEYTISDGVHTAIGTVLITLRPRFGLHNGYDVNNDGNVTALDALLVINYINAYGVGPIIGLGQSAAAQKLFYDVVPDNLISANDPLAVINVINAIGPGPADRTLSLLSLSGGDPFDLTALDALLAGDDEKKWL